MNQTTAIMHREHALVRRLLDCLDALAVRGNERGRLDRWAAKEALTLLERFVDWNHQDKEELHLFPHLLSRARAGEARLLERLFMRHSEERRRLVGMHLHIEHACFGNSANLERFIMHARLYAGIHRNHLREEEEYVLPLADVILTPEDERAILHGFEQIDSRLGAPQDVEDRIAKLCLHLDVDADFSSLETRVAEPLLAA